MSEAGGKLVLVPTPIGNLEDITLRALRTLKECDEVWAEDTRTTGQLLKHYEIQKPLTSFHIHNEHHKTKELVARIASGKVLCLVSDAGTPALSDPGFLAVREVLKEGLEVESLPGASALLPALTASGMSTDRFLFEGFLPHKKGRQTRMASIADEACTVVLYESPHRLLKTLEQLIPFCGEERQVCVARELTKHFEEYVRGTLTEALAHFQTHAPKGEIVLILSGKPEK